jgi:superfamily II DNA or RNA helicase
MIQDTELIGNRKVFFVHGGTETDDREEIRRIMETEEDAIVVASYGTFSTGINIRNLHNVIFAFPYKAQIKILQSIGRVLRIGANKTKATLFDIVDDMRHKKYVNHTMKQFMERVKIYTEQKFPFKLYKIGLKNGRHKDS